MSAFGSNIFDCFHCILSCFCREIWPPGLCGRWPCWRSYQHYRPFSKCVRFRNRAALFASVRVACAEISPSLLPSPCSFLHCLHVKRQHMELIDVTPCNMFSGLHTLPEMLCDGELFPQFFLVLASLALTPIQCY